MAEAASDVHMPSTWTSELYDTIGEMVAEMEDEIMGWLQSHDFADLEAVRSSGPVSMTHKIAITVLRE